MEKFNHPNKLCERKITDALHNELNLFGYRSLTKMLYSDSYLYKSFEIHGMHILLIHIFVISVHIKGSSCFNAWTFTSFTLLNDEHNALILHSRENLLRFIQFCLYLFPWYILQYFPRSYDKYPLSNIKL